MIISSRRYDVVNLFFFSCLFHFQPRFNALIALAMTRAFRQYPICHRSNIIQPFACVWVFALHRTNNHTPQLPHNCTRLPLPPPILTGYMVHAALLGCFWKKYLSKLQQEKWHHNKGYARVAVISCMPLDTGAQPQKKVNEVGTKSGGKRGN